MNIPTIRSLQVEAAAAPAAPANAAPARVGPTRPKPCAVRRAFSLVEVLLAVFILGIGMIMVASVFPVGAAWTQQTTEGSVGQVISQAALLVINTHYGPGGDLRGYLDPNYFFLDSSGNPQSNAVPNVAAPGNQNTILLAPANPNFPNNNPPYRNPNNPLKIGNQSYPLSPFTLQALPGFQNISANERAYQFAKSNSLQNAFPVDDPSKCTYFWTALARLNPAHRVNSAVSGAGSDVNGILPAASYKYDVYILVFHKGWSDQKFTYGTANPVPWWVPNTVKPDLATAPDLSLGEVLNTRVVPPLPTNGSQKDPEPLMPSTFYMAYSPGLHNPGTTPVVQRDWPQMGEYGIGAFSGTVFRQSLNPGTDLSTIGIGGAVAKPAILFDTGTNNFEPVIYCPPADNTSTSPLIYVYQTTLSF